MRPSFVFATGAAGALTIAALVATSSDAAAPSSSSAPAVVELYQSQGCSSCPPADASLNAIADDPNVIALNFAVTYWDYLGWKDTFAKKAFTQRQYDYASASGRGGVATPQMIIDGRTSINGGNLNQVRQVVARSHLTGGPDIDAGPSSVTIGAMADAKPATIWLVRYDPRTIQVPIRAGENGGRTIAHRNIVRSLDALGTWDGSKRSFAVSPSKEGYRSAVLIQTGKGGPIVAAAKI